MIKCGYGHSQRNLTPTQHVETGKLSDYWAAKKVKKKSFLASENICTQYT